MGGDKDIVPGLLLIGGGVLLGHLLTRNRLPWWLGGGKEPADEACPQRRSWQPYIQMNDVVDGRLMGGECVGPTSDKELGTPLFTYQEITVPARSMGVKIGLGYGIGVWSPLNAKHLPFEIRQNSNIAGQIRLSQGTMTWPASNEEVMVYLDNMSDEDVVIPPHTLLFELVVPIVNQCGIRLDTPSAEE